MIESLITISLVGLTVGIIFSMPIAGPVSILITSHGLKGQLRYCITAAVGAAIVDIVVCFVVVHGFTRLYGVIVDFVPYILFCGSIILFLIGLKIVKARFDLNHLDIKQGGLRRFLKVPEKNGFWTGFLLNASNPSIFFGWLTSSTIVMSFVASVGLNVGGIDHVLGNNIVIINSFASNHSVTKEMIKTPKVPRIIKADASRTVRKHENTGKYSNLFHWLFSLSYAFFLGVGTVVWFSLLAYLLVRNRAKLKIGFITKMIHSLGIILCAFAVYLMGSAMGLFASISRALPR